MNPKLKDSLGLWFSDIRFWIILFFMIRLYGITFPPLENGNNWRQADVLMVARNFYENGPDVLHPMIDVAGDKSGITGMEFPLFNYLIYLAALIFGYDHWYGRLINLVVSSIGIFFFFKLVKKYFGERTAFFSSIILLSSLWFTFSRKIMPDTFASSLTIISIYFGCRFLDKGNWKTLLFYFLLGVAGVLSKISTVFAFGLLLVPFLKTGKRIIQLQFLVASLFILVPAIYWYFVWVPFLVEKYGYWHFFMGKPFGTGLSEILSHLPKTLNRFYETALQLSGFAIFLIGFYYAISKKNKTLLCVLFTGSLLFLPIMIKSGKNFFHHSYYILPFVPVMALVAGYGLANIRYNKIVAALLLVFFIDASVNDYLDFKIPAENRRWLALEPVLDQISQPHDLIAINGGSSPTAMYFAHRKGWTFYTKDFTDEATLKNLQSHGCQFIVLIRKSGEQEISLPFAQVYNDDNLTVYRL